MPNRRTYAARLAADMKRLGIERIEGVGWSRPRIKGNGASVANIADSFAAGDSVESLACAFEVKRSQILNAIRFHILYPKSDLPSFWRAPKTKGYEEFLKKEDSPGDAK